MGLFLPSAVAIYSLLKWPSQSSRSWSDEDNANADAEIGLKLAVDRWLGTGFDGLYVEAEANSHPLTPSV
jgi:hypothetical protein